MTVERHETQSSQNPLRHALELIAERVQVDEAAETSPIVDAAVMVVANLPDGNRCYLYCSVTAAQRVTTAQRTATRRDLAHAALEEVGQRPFAPRYVWMWFAAGTLYGAALMGAVWWSRLP